MKKLLLAVAAITISAASVNAQDKEMKKGETTFSIAGNIGHATTPTYFNLVAGGDIQVDIPATTGLKITVSGGYESFSWKIGTSKGHSSYIPLLAGAKFNLSTNLYGHAQLGYSIFTGRGGGGQFTYAPSLGYMFSKNFDASVKYLGLNHVGGIVARLAYNF